MFLLSELYNGLLTIKQEATPFMGLMQIQFRLWYA